MPLLSPQGFEYKRAAGQCCGECVQTACLTPDGPPVQVTSEACGGRSQLPPWRPSPPTGLRTRDHRYSASTLTLAFQLNETWVNSRVDNCTVYHCEVESGVYLLTPQPASCPEVSSCRVCAGGPAPAWEAPPLPERPHPCLCGPTPAWEAPPLPGWLPLPRREAPPTALPPVFGPPGEPQENRLLLLL